MSLLARVHFKVLLILLESNAVTYTASKHHLGAVHEVVHHVFQSRTQGQLVDHVEVYFVLCCYLDSDVSFDVVNKASFLKAMVLFPTEATCLFVKGSFEKEDLVRGACN